MVQALQISKIMLNNYPFEITVKDKIKVCFRPFDDGDLKKLKQFFKKIPSIDLLIYKDDVTEKEKIDSWFTDNTWKKVVQLVAVADSKIIAKGSLHDGGLFWQKTAEIKLIVDPKYRDKGIGSQMFNILLCEGLRHRFQKIVVRYMPDNKRFIRILDHYGFTPETILNYYIDDKKTKQHKDLIIASFNLQDWERRFEFYNLLFESN